MIVPSTIRHFRVVTRALGRLLLSCLTTTTVWKCFVLPCGDLWNCASAHAKQVVEAFVLTGLQSKHDDSLQGPALATIPESTRALSIHQAPAFGGPYTAYRSGFSVWYCMHGNMAWHRPLRKRR